MRLFGHSIDEISNIVLIGGGETCEEVVTAIYSQDTNIKIIEKNVNIAEKLSEKLNNVSILHGDPLDFDVLTAADIDGVEMVISMTIDDKTNILACLLAKKLGAKRVAAVLNDSSYSELLSSLGGSTIIDSRSAAISKILHYLRKGDIEDVIELENGEVEVIVIDVSSRSHAVGILIEDIESKNEIYVAAIYRDNKAYMAPQQMLINVDDKIMFSIRKNLVEKVLKLFQDKPKYLA
jgi:trk system potassium uptake protein TrkA